MLKPEIGQFCTLDRLQITVIGYQEVKVAIPGRSSDVWIPLGLITALAPKPWEPKVGDIVVEKGDVLSNFQYRVLALHGSNMAMVNGLHRRWAVVAHGDDVPKVVNVANISPCAG